jgi:hypothetical protein
VAILTAPTDPCRSRVHAAKSSTGAIARPLYHNLP